MCVVYFFCHLSRFFPCGFFHGVWLDFSCLGSNYLPLVLCLFQKPGSNVLCSELQSNGVMHFERNCKLIVPLPLVVFFYKPGSNVLCKELQINSAIVKCFISLSNVSVAI